MSISLPLKQVCAVTWAGFALGTAHLVLLGSFLLAPISVSNAADEKSADRAKQPSTAPEKSTDHSYRLEHKLKSGEQVHYEVTHLVTVKTEVQGSAQSNQSRSKSMKLWDVHDQDSSGATVFTNSIGYVDMWSETTGRQPIRYDSRDDAEPPPEYEVVAKTIGKPLSIITMSPTGEVVSREDQIGQIDLGMGAIAVPLPDEPVKIGSTWSSPSSVTVRLEDKSVKKIKIRRQYQLEKVAAGVATIAVKTQVLTPVDDPKVESQLIQRLSQGVIKFDIDAGRVLSKQLDWDETVVSFSGPDSRMEYLGRMTEKLVEPRMASSPKR